MTETPPGKKVVFGLIIALLLYCLMEGVSWAFYLIHEQEVFSFSAHQEARNAVTQPDTRQNSPKRTVPLPSINSEVIHPYLGFVVDPTQSSGYSEYGFPGDAPLFPERAREALVIGVFGGSFADGTVQFGGDEILRRLRRDSRFADREIIIQRIALGGYKQPQQLLALTYFLSLGARLDVVVNLDGFNEVALAPAENAGIVNPFFPRGWAARTGDLVDPVALRLVGRMAIIDDQLNAWAESCSRMPLRINITANLVWRYRHISLHQQRVELAERLQHHLSESRGDFSYVMTGPSFPVESENELFQELARVWMRASLQMHHLCRENGIEYVHFLQPNQYLPGSKPFSSEELDNAFDEDHPYRYGVLEGYPLLIEEGKRLREHGVDFIDLTGIFSTSTQTLYSDTCCHVGPAGYEMIGAAVGDGIRQHGAEGRQE